MGTCVCGLECKEEGLGVLSQRENRNGFVHYCAPEGRKAKVLAVLHPATARGIDRCMLF